jgi:hypothetical protein
MSAHDLTRQGVVRALSAAVAGSTAVDAALRSRAADVTTRAASQGLEARILRRGAGQYAVEVSGPGLFSRAFGSVEAPPDDVVADIVGDGS